MEFLTVAETARILRVSPITIRRYIASGRLPAERVGRGIRVRREAIDDFVTPIISRASNRPTRESLDKPFTMDDPLWNMVGIGRSDGPNDVARTKHKYLADAVAAPSSVDQDSESSDSVGRSIEKVSPLVNVVGNARSNTPAAGTLNQDELPTLYEILQNIIGIGQSDEPHDVSTNKYKYVAEAYLSDKG